MVEENREITKMEPLLQEYEGIIEKGLDTLKEVGEALMIIKEQKLYKASHSNFGDYCRERWKFTQQHAGRFIVAAKVVEEIESEPNGSVPPVTEAQARALAKSKNVSKFWKMAQKLTGKEQPTAREIEEVIKGHFSDDVIEAEIVDVTNTNAGNVIDSTLEDKDVQGILYKPYELGKVTHKSGRAQIAVNADDISANRLTKLKEFVSKKYDEDITKGAIVGQALALLEHYLLKKDLQHKVSV